MNFVTKKSTNERCLHLNLLDIDYQYNLSHQTDTIRYKLLEGEDFHEFGELPVIHQNFL